jgi:hypothetical protein
VWESRGDAEREVYPLVRINQPQLIAVLLVHSLEADRGETRQQGFQRNQCAVKSLRIAGDLRTDCLYAAPAAFFGSGEKLLVLAVPGQTKALDDRLYVHEALVAVLTGQDCIAVDRTSCCMGWISLTRVRNH